MTNGLESEVRELLHPLRICTPPLPSLPTSDEREDREDCGVREERFFHGRQIQFILRSQFPAPRLAIEGRVHLIPRQPLLSAVSICGKAFHSPDIRHFLHRLRRVRGSLHSRNHPRSRSSVAKQRSLQRTPIRDLETELSPSDQGS